MKGKGLLVFLLSTALILALLPVSARAARGGDFVVTGSTSGYSYGADGVLAFIADGNYTVSMTPREPWEGSATTTDRILVHPGLSVHLTLDNVAIELGYTADIRESALEMVGADVTLTLVGQSTLRSRYRTCILAPADSTLTINGTGSLEALGGQMGVGGAGIGGGVLADGSTVLPDSLRSSLDGGTVFISSGTVLAGGGYGAGIGGCGSPEGSFLGGVGSTVTITGGAVTAIGGWGGAGIGGGPAGGDGGAVTISGGTVFAGGSANTGGSKTYSGAGIGGSGSIIIDLERGGAISYFGGNSGSVSITGGTVTAGGGPDCAGIGGGISGRGGDIAISGGTVNATSVYGGLSIGSGTYGGGGGSLHNGAGADVYLTEITLIHVGSPAASEPVGEILNDAGYAYGVTDTYTDADGKLYLYLPAGTATSAVKLLPSPRKFAGTITTTPGAAAGAFTYDQTAPAIAAVAPAGSLAPLSGSVSISFDEEMRAGPGAVSLSPDGKAWTLLGAGTWSADNTVYTASYSGFPEQTYYSVKAENFMDFNGNAMDTDNGHSFRTLPVIYPISYALGDGADNTPNPASYTIDDAFTLGDPTRPGYTFIGWSGTGIDEAPATTVAVSLGSMGERSYAAHWTANSYTLSFDTRGSGALSARSVTFDAAVGSLPSPAPEKANHVFSGWNTQADGRGTWYTDATIYRTAGNLTLYAVWSSIPTAPDYQAGVKTGGGETTIPVTVDYKTGTASIAVSAQTPMQGGSVITVPSIPNIGAYAVALSVQSLSGAAKQGTLAFHTALGGVTIPSNMLIAGTNGSRAQIGIGRGDKSALADDVKAAVGDRPLISLTLSIDGRQTDWRNPDAPVTVSIPYTPTAEELADSDNIVIWYIDGAGRAITVPNGRYDPVADTLTFTTTHFSLYAVAFKPVTFSDVPKNAWYANAVSFLAARDITTGTGGGNYSPEAKLTRADFLVLMMRAYGIEADMNPTDNFSDAGSAYYTGYLAAAKRLGISNGVGDHKYAPAAQITRQEMFTLLYNTLGIIGQLPPECEDPGAPSVYAFADAGDIASWAREAMTLLVGTGTVGGSGGRLMPTAAATRAEMAQVLYKLLDK